MGGTLERIQELCKQNNTNVKTVEQALGFSNGTIGKWKKAQDVPYGKIKAVADFLNTTPEYILYGELNVHKSASGKEYYFDDQTAELAQKLHNDPKMNIYMSSSAKLTPDQFEAVNTMIKAFLRKDGLLDDD